MKVLRHTSTVLLSALLASASLGMVACERDGPVEDAAEEIDDAVDEVGDEIDDGIDEN